MNLDVLDQVKMLLGSLDNRRLWYLQHAINKEFFRRIEPEMARQMDQDEKDLYQVLSQEPKKGNGGLN